MLEHPDDRLIGFDVRLLSRGPPAPLLDPAARARHLPRTDLKALVSFDRRPCPQRFVHRDRLTTGRSLRCPPGDYGIGPGCWRVFSNPGVPNYST